MNALDRTRELGVARLGVYFPDLNGLPRGKEVAAQDLRRVLADGFGLTAAVFALDYGGDAVEGTGLGSELLFRDLIVRPDADTVRSCPWRPDAALAVADVELAGELASFAPRTLLRRIIGEYRQAGLSPILGVELELHLLRPTTTGGLEPYDDLPGGLYMPLGRLFDPHGVVDRLHRWCELMELPVTLLAREFSPGQYELNLQHDGALDAVDAAFLFKITAKEAAAEAGLVATFMGRPLDSLGGSGLHFHVSLERADGSNAFDDPTGLDGLSMLARSFVGGCLAHLSGSTAVMSPNVNAYKRFATLSLAPYHRVWGLDNRTAALRVPSERDTATRVEHRLADASANPYTSAALVLAAGLDGIRRELDPGPPFAADASRTAELDLPTVPLTLRDALRELELDELVTGFLGGTFVQAFTALKRAELRRFESTVTDWETRQYVRHL